MTDKRSYDDQIKVWAANKYDLNTNRIRNVEIKSVFHEGYDCCGGRDPGCYCSLASSSYMSLEIIVWDHDGVNIGSESFDMEYGDMGKLIQEIYEA